MLQNTSINPSIEFQSEYYPIIKDKYKISPQYKQWLLQHTSKTINTRILAIDQQNQYNQQNDKRYVRYLAHSEGSSEIRYISENNLRNNITNQLIQLNKKQQKQHKKYYIHLDDLNLHFNMQLMQMHKNQLLVQKYKKYRYYGNYNLRCKYCKEKGHHIQQCPVLYKDKIYRAAYICFLCKKRGHVKKNCPKNCNRISRISDYQEQQGTYQKGLVIQVTLNSYSNIDIQY